MTERKRQPVPAVLRDLIDEAASHVTAAEEHQPDGPLGPAKSVLLDLVRRSTWHQRAYDRVVLEALEAVSAELDAAASVDESLASIEERLSLLDDRLVQLEKRAARSEALLATLATDLHQLRVALDNPQSR